MDNLFQKANVNLHCCGISLLFEGEFIPSTIENWQPFSNTTTEENPQETYASISTIEFSEASDKASAGFFWIQKVNYSFPVTDALRSERLELLTKVTGIAIKLDNNTTLFVGRNDFNRNAKPTAKIKTNQQTAGVEFEFKSISPAGFIPLLKFGLPTFIPITLNP